jgi:hypothetical protein
MKNAGTGDHFLYNCSLRHVGHYFSGLIEVALSRQKFERIVDSSERTFASRMVQRSGCSNFYFYYLNLRYDSYLSIQPRSKGGGVLCL